MMFIPRTLGGTIEQAAREFPAVVVTGPRQSGKTTLLKHLFGGRYRYVSIEPPDIRSAAQEDPRGFLDHLGTPAILDEIQYAPDLLPYIKERIDADRAAVGRYVLTGSQNLLVAERVSESLAGRAAVLRLLPLTRREADGRPEAPFPWEANRRSFAEEAKPTDWAALLRGSYPEVVADPTRDAALWHASYAQTYLERDVRSVRQIGDLTQFQAFLRALAARAAQLLRLSELARDLGLAVNTVKAWLSVLEATYQVIVVRPYFANVSKRLVKTPKLYFTDVGTLGYLTGLRDPEHARSGPMAGALFENAVVAEVFKTLVHRGVDPRIHFWRTSAGAEVDLLVETNGEVVPVEIKSSSTPRPAFAAAIHALRRDLGERMRPGYVVHPGDVQLPLGGGVTALPFGEL